MPYESFNHANPDSEPEELDRDEPEQSERGFPVGYNGILPDGQIRSTDARDRIRKLRARANIANLAIENPRVERAFRRSKGDKEAMDHARRLADKRNALSGMRDHERIAIHFANERIEARQAKRQNGDTN